MHAFLIIPCKFMRGGVLNECHSKDSAFPALAMEVMYTFRTIITIHEAVFNENDGYL